MLAYNNYLEEVETLTFNLLHNTDVAATEALLASHAAQNAAASSRKAASSGKESASADLSAQREAARRKEENEKRELAETIGSGQGDTEAAAAGEGPLKKVTLKKSTARRTAAEKAARVAASSGGGGGDIFGSSKGSISAAAEPLGYTIKGLKPIPEPETERPYDAFGGLVPLTLQPPQYYVLQETYEHPWLDQARSDPATQAGGYDLREYYARAMVEAFAGLGCFVGDEKLHARAQAAGSEKDVVAAAGVVGAAEAGGGT